MAVPADNNLPAPAQEALGQSEAFLAFSEALSKAARVDRPVLILGERGTGKELAASRLHFLSPRWQEPLVALNCAALAATLIESELFGYEAGAFTGALGRRAGRFEAAHQGTLFLDEIGSIPLTVQEKILRVVEYGTFERVGSSRPSRVEVRIVAATNADLPALAQQGLFKQDLLDRLSFEVLVLPPLRQRGEDVLLLARHFAGRMARELGRNEAPRFSPRVEAELMAHPWPGNVRELKNLVERAVYRSPGPGIEAVEFDPFADWHPQPPPAAAPPAPPSGPGRQSGQPLPGDFKEAVNLFERRLLHRALAAARFNQAAAARSLNLSYHQMRGLLRKHGGLKQVMALDQDKAG